jgi:integrase
MVQKNFYLNKRGKIWYTRIRDPKSREIGSPLSTGQTNRTRAELWAGEEYAKLEKQTSTGRILYSEWIGRFYKAGCPHCSSAYDRKKPVGETTMKQNRGYIDKIILKDQICELSVGGIRRADVLDFKDRIIALKGRSRTSQMVFQIFCTSLREAVSRGLIELNPSAGEPKIAYEKKIRGAVPFDAVKRILLPEHWDDIVMWRMAKTAAYTGIRAGEARGLLWQGLDNPKGRISIYNNRPAHLSKDKTPKWGKVRETIYPTCISEILEPLRPEDNAGYVFAVEGGPVGYDAIANALDRACVKAEVRATMHQLRHSLHTYLRGQGVPDDVLCWMFGWSMRGSADGQISRVQENYTHRELYDLTTTARVIDGLA